MILSSSHPPLELVQSLDADKIPVTQVTFFFFAAQFTSAEGIPAGYFKKGNIQGGKHRVIMNFKRFCFIIITGKISVPLVELKCAVIVVLEAYCHPREITHLVVNGEETVAKRAFEENVPLVPEFVHPGING